MFTLKTLSPDALEAAIAKAERYRLLNEPLEAASICEEVLLVALDHRQALVWLLLSLTDQFGHNPRAVPQAVQVLSQIQDPYEKAYYSGIFWERGAKARYQEGGLGGRQAAHYWLHRAMSFLEAAEKVRPHGNDDSLLRWNACARFFMQHPELQHEDQEELGVPAMLE